MKAKVEKLVREPCELEITGATLLTVDEARNLLTVEDRACGSWWWLRSPGNSLDCAANVDDDGNVYVNGGLVNGYCVGVRPALQIANLESTNLEIGDEFYIGEQRFKVISYHLALCNSIVGYSRFDREINNYERSDIKLYVDYWFDELMNRGADA